MCICLQIKGTQNITIWKLLRPRKQSPRLLKTTDQAFCFLEKGTGFTTLNSIQTSTQQHVVSARYPQSFINGGKRLTILTEKFICYEIKISSSLTFKTTKKLDA